MPGLGGNAPRLSILVTAGRFSSSAVAITDQLRQQADCGGVHYNPLHFWPHLTDVLLHLPAVAPDDQAGIDQFLPIIGW